MNRFRSQMYLQIMALPAVIWIAIFCYLPMFGLVIAFTDYSIFKSMSLGPFTGLSKFIEFFKDPSFFNVLSNTLGISLFKMSIGFPLPIILAIMLNEIKMEGFKRTVQTISYLPHFLSWIILAGVLINWLSDSGMITSILVKAGILKNPVYLLGYPQYFWSIAVISDVWKEVGFNSIIYIAAITSIDTTIYEAASIDGAGRMGKILYVTLPGISHTVLIIFILSIAHILNNNFDQIFALYNTANSYRSQTIDMFIYKRAFSFSGSGGQYSFSAAASLTRGIISALLLFSANSISRRLSDKSVF